MKVNGGVKTAGKECRATGTDEFATVVAVSQWLATCHIRLADE